MKLSYQISSVRRTKADTVAVFISQDEKLFNKELAEMRKLLGSKIDQAIKLENFSGKEGELLSFFTDKKFSAPRIFLVGLGLSEKRSLESYRRAAATSAKKARLSKTKHLAVVIPGESSNGKASVSDVAQAIVEGVVLSVYKFGKYLTDKKEKDQRLKEVTLVGMSHDNEKLIKKAIAEARILCEAVYLARDLENAPGSEIYPETLAAAAQKSAGQYGFLAKVWDRNRIQQTGFGGLLAVNAGSAKPPRFIVLEHNSGQKELDTIVLVGKGITFDSGGISIKPASGMSEMKMDMSGAAAVIGALEASARLRLPVHLVGLIPATENMPGGGAMKPGDIIIHYGGKTSEVDNTDAEGRLVLADALAYAGKFNPKAVIDLATLTGACVVALGNHATGMMGNDEELMAKLKAAGEKTYERVWQLPMFDEYEKQIKSDVADVKNVGGRWAGAITAGWFLKKFVGDCKWVHLDIAGTAMIEEELPYIPKGGSGVGVRLLTEFLRNWTS